MSDTKTTADDEAKAREAEDKKAAEQNARDLETFLSFHRGEMLARDERGCLDLGAVFEADAARKDEESS